MTGGKTEKKEEVENSNQVQGKMMEWISRRREWTA